MRKLIPNEDWEDPDDTYVPPPKARSRRYMNKVMFLGIVARPFTRLFLDGKIYLKRISKMVKVKRRSEHKKFVPDGCLNALIREGDWRNHSQPEQTVGELLDLISEHYGLHEDVQCGIALTYKSLKRTKQEKITLTYSDEHTLVLEGRTIKEKTSVASKATTRNLTIQDLELVVVKNPDDEYEQDCSCDSTFMLGIMEEIGDAIRSYYWFLPFFISIYLMIDNAGGHGTNKAKKEYEKLLREKYNVILVFQIPNSPETNLLDLGVWRSLQSLVEKLSFRDRYDPDVLSQTVFRAWDNFSSSAIEKVYKRWELVLKLILLDTGGNRYVESFRGKLTGDPTSASSTSSKQPRPLPPPSSSTAETVPLIPASHDDDLDRLYQVARIEHADQSAETTTMAEENEMKHKEETNLSLADLRSNLRNQISPQLPSSQIPLTSTENELIDDALFNPRSRRKGRDTLGRFANHIITRRDIETLRPCIYLNDTIINYFIKVLTYRDQHLSTLCEGRKRSHFFSSFFFNCYGTQDIRRWAQKVPGGDIFKLDKLF